MNAVLEWVKANMIIVVFAVLMIAAAITLPILSSGMNNKVRAEVNTRAQNLSKLSQLEKGEILPGHTGPPNERTLARYQEVARIISDDAMRVRNAAIEHNRKGRTVLIPSLFPEPPARDIDVLPEQFHRKLLDAYGTLLADIKAGMPPTLENMRQDLELFRKQFITQDLKKDTNEALDAEQTRRLQERLSGRRLTLCVDVADRIGMYVSTDQLGVPQWNQAYQPSLGELFNWQWQFWIASDVLRALHEANRDDQKVRAAPVKAVRSFHVVGLPMPADVSQGSGGGGGGGVSRPSMGGFGSGAGVMDAGGGGGGAAAAPAATQGSFDPKVEVPKNYAASITGRISNQLYDVVNVEMELIVETSRLPQVLDSLARYNFMTVTNLALSKADAYEALESGYFFGSEPVCSVHLTLETIWLREWTQQFMPAAIRQGLGIGTTQAAAPEAPIEG